MTHIYVQIMTDKDFMWNLSKSKYIKMFFLFSDLLNFIKPTQVRSMTDPNIRKLWKLRKTENFRSSVG